MQQPFLRLLQLLCFAGWVAAPIPALATQTHGGAEGLIIHQLAHLFYLVSMAILIYWLRQRRLTAASGWRMIQYAAVFLILWNLDAFLVHTLDELPGIVSAERIGGWQVIIRTRPSFEYLAGVYYTAKLDHLLCVPALVFLYLGLKRLLTENRRAGGARP